MTMFNKMAKRCIRVLAASLCVAAQAQVKVGSNPTTLASDVNLQVEATDGKQVVVRKSTAQVGIGTSTPGNTLEVNSGTSGASGVRLTQLPSVNVVGTNANGDIISSSGTGTTNTLTATSGSTVTSTVNGTSAVLTPAADTIASSSALGFSSTGALVKGSAPVTNTLTAASGSAITGTVSGTAAALTPPAGTIASASTLGFNSSGALVKGSACTCGQITAAAVTSLGGDWKLMNGAYSSGSCGAPVVDARNAVLVTGGATGTTSTATALAQNQLPNVTLTGSTSSNGGHSHTVGFRVGPYATTYTEITGGHNSAGSPWNYPSTSTNGAHTHTLTTSSINGGVTQQSLTTANLPRLNVNWFICIN